MRRHWLVLVGLVSLPSFGQEDEPPPTELEEGAETEADPGFARLTNPAFPSPPLEAVPVDRGELISREALTPYFAEGTPAEAKAAFDAGDFKRAVELLTGVPDAVPVRFLRALAAMRSTDWKFAAPEFEKLATDYPPLRDRCLVHAGWAYEQLHEWDNAIRVFEQVSAGSRQTPDARLGLARAWRWARDSKKGMEAIAGYLERPAPPWGRDVGAEALLAMADLYAARRDAKNEQASLVKLWARHPLSREAGKAESRIADLTAVSAEWLVVRAEALIDAHRNAQGVAILEPLLPSLKAVPDALGCQATFALGKGYRKLRQHAKAIATLAPLKRCRDPELKAKALFTLGFSQTISAPTLAIGTYEALAAAAPENALADDALFFAAEVALRKGDRERAVERLIDVVDRYPRGDFAADALFKLFWIARAENRLDEGLEFLSEIEGRWAHQDDGHDVERARYWRGRVYEAQGRQPEALAAWESVAREHPATYYGLISRERVTALDEARGLLLGAETAAATETKDPFPLYAGPLSKDPQFASAVELLRLGFGELVPMEILAIDRTALPPDSLRLMVLVLAQSGQQRSAHGLARLWLKRDLSGPISAQGRAIWEIAYPNVFRDLVVTYSAKADDLDPDLLQALMREESALDPRALSWAGALGLCQLMPATAAGVAMQLKLKSPRQAQLLEPELNIQLGARYLADLMSRMKGVKPFALGSYNAGESAVNRWRRDNGDAELDAWVEEVPLQETRGYIKRVLRSYNTYKLLYAPGQLASTRPAPPPKSG